MEKYLPSIYVASGVSNILLIKWADILIDSSGNRSSSFSQHPFLQATLLFFSQLLCLLVYKILFYVLRRRQDGSEDRNFLTAGRRNFHASVFFLPAVLDVIATSMLMIGLYLTYGSSFQIIQGLSVVFCGIFSSSFFNLPMRINHWIGIMIIVTAAVLIGLSDYLENIDNKSLKAFITGDLFIGCAQIFKGIQLVYEERYIKVLDIAPLHVIGWEGVFGFTITFLSLIPLNYLKNFPSLRESRSVDFGDLLDALAQIFGNYTILTLHLVFIFSIIFYMFSGMSLCKKLSASHRSAFDCIRTIVIFFVSMHFEWAQIYYLQILSFALLFLGVLVYRNMVFVDCFRWLSSRWLTHNTLDNSADSTLIQAADEI